MLFDEISNLAEPAERPHMGERQCGERPDMDAGLVCERGRAG
jgi:hypothetical protein